MPPSCRARRGHCGVDRSVDRAAVRATVAATSATSPRAIIPMPTRRDASRRRGPRRAPRPLPTSLPTNATRQHRGQRKRRRLAATSTDSPIATRNTGMQNASPAWTRRSRIRSARVPASEAGDVGARDRRQTAHGLNQPGERQHQADQSGDAAAAGVQHAGGVVGSSHRVRTTEDGAHQTQAEAWRRARRGARLPQPRGQARRGRGCRR